MRSAPKRAARRGCVFTVCGRVPTTRHVTAAVPRGRRGRLRGASRGRRTDYSRVNEGDRCVELRWGSGDARKPAALA